MRVAIYGGTGFVGSYLIDELIGAGHDLAVLVRPGSEDKVRHRERCRIVPGDIGDGDAVAEVLTGCDAAIYNIGILRESPSAGITFQALQYEGAKLAVETAMARGVGRFVLMSANGVKAHGTAYQETKYLAERFLAQSELDYTIFRPSVVFGDPRGRMEFCTQLRDDMILPPIPAPGFFSGTSPAKGGFSMSPVHVRDVALAFVRSLEVSDTFGGTYVLCGPEALAWPEIIRRIAAAVGRRKTVVPVPAGLVRAAASALDRFESFPITRDQLDMLMEGNTGDSREIFSMLGIKPLRFDVENLAYLK
jgi:NADH dehydrogenase